MYFLDFSMNTELTSINNAMPIKTKYKDSGIAHIPSKNDYEKVYNESIHDSDSFWAKIAARISWIKKWDKVSNIDFSQAKINWFEGAKLNISYNCLDRHVESGYGSKLAFIWEGNRPGEDKKYTYSELLEEVEKFSNVLKSLGVNKGDRVCIYMQMIPELAIAMLSCSRIGAVHSIVFGAFSSDSLSHRINDAECKVLITQDSGVRGEKNNIPMKHNADKAVDNCPTIESVVIVKRTGSNVAIKSGRDFWWHECMNSADNHCPPEEMDAEDPLFILYTSGSTGKPKGILHTTAGYIVYVSYTHEMIFILAYI